MKYTVLVFLLLAGLMVVSAVTGVGIEAGPLSGFHIHQSTFAEASADTPFHRAAPQAQAKRVVDYS